MLYSDSSLFDSLAYVLIFSFASIANVGIIIVTGQIFPRPSFNCPNPLMSHPFAVRQPIVLKNVFGSFLSYPSLPDQSTFA